MYLELNPPVHVSPRLLISEEQHPGCWGQSTCASPNPHGEELTLQLSL
jgi:hypothetical protein